MKRITIIIICSLASRFLGVQVVNFFLTFFHPSLCWLCLTGSFERSRMRKLYGEDVGVEGIDTLFEKQKITTFL